MAAYRAARAKALKRLAAKWKADMEKYKGTKAYEVMTKCGGDDHRINWAEIEACLTKEGMSQDDIDKKKKDYVNIV